MTYLRWTLVSTAIVTLASCGANFVDKKESNDNGAERVQLTGETDCFELGKNTPHQGDTPHQGKPGGKPIVIEDPDIVVKKPGKFPCGDSGKTPGQHPGKTPGQHPGHYPDDCDKGCGDDVYRPIDEPNPFPGQHPIDDGKCGKEGFFCGGPGQHPGQWKWPGTTIKGGSYHKGDVEACMNAFHNAGYDSTGMWGVDVRTIKSVSILSHDVIEDYGTGQNVVIIKSVGVLGSLEFRLLNPNALYCIKSTNVLQDVKIASCHSQNVVFGRDVNVLSHVQTMPVQCP